MSDAFDVTIVGGGIVGLATALRVQQRRPALRIAVLEKEPELATHQSGHNSGVLHAGLYYQPGSLKARLCREGKAEIEAFAEAHGIPIDHPGKLVVAVDPSELGRLDALRERAVANGVPGLEDVGKERIRELEPHAAGIRGLWSPRTGVIDFRRIALAIADDLRAAGVAIRTEHAVSAIDARSSGRRRHDRAGRCPQPDRRRVRGAPGRSSRGTERRHRRSDDRPVPR